MMRRYSLALLGLILLAYAALAIQYARLTPIWQVPDEPAHYNYIRQIAETGQIPVIELGDWDSEYQDLLKATGFHPDHTGEISRIQYEDHQPPLYYLMAAPVFQLGGGDILVLRLFSVLLGLGVIASAFAAINRLFPGSPWLALGTAGFVAFVPQNLAMIGSVNNDVLAQLITGLALFFAIHYLEKEDEGTSGSLRCAFLLGILAGLAFWTKTTVYFVAGINGLAILLKWRRRQWSRIYGIRQLAAFVLPAVLMGSVWWLHNIDVYGGMDFLGLDRHDAVAAGQLQTDDYIQTTLGGDKGAYFKNMGLTTFHSFWGQFGWMGVPMEGRVYKALWLYCAILLAGSVFHFWWEYGQLSGVQRDALLLFALTTVLVAAAFFLYNRQFVQFQGRYLFAALIPLGFLSATGFSGWAGLLTQRVPLLRWSPLIGTVLLVFLAWYALNTYVVPGLPNWN